MESLFIITSVRSPVKKKAKETVGIRNLYLTSVPKDGNFLVMLTGSGIHYVH